ncbi:MAG: hypothetical protein K1W16_10890 [Lachnospiraceae bacterium]|jgi:hypothetical protein
MIAFDKEHSPSWLALMKDYQRYRAAVFRWVEENAEVKQKDLLMELTPLFGNKRDLSRRLLVTDFLQSTDMWDEKTIALVWKELTQIALSEQEEVAGWAAQALLKIKSSSVRACIIEEIFLLAQQELKKDKLDFVLFGMGCTLLWQLGSKECFERFCTLYKNEIYFGIGFDETDFKEMAQSIK